MGDTYHALFYHFLWSTKHRVPSMNKDIRERVYPYMGGILRNLDSSLLAIGGVEDHVHLLAKLPPSIAVMKVAQVVKANSSKFIHETFPELRSFDWQDGYTAFTVSRSGIPAVERYLLGQEDHHLRSRSSMNSRCFLHGTGWTTSRSFWTDGRGGGDRVSPAPRAWRLLSARDPPLTRRAMFLRRLRRLRECIGIRWGFLSGRSDEYPRLQEPDTWA